MAFLGIWVSFWLAGEGHPSKKQESCAIAGRTARCRCKFRYLYQILQ